MYVLVCSQPIIDNSCPSGLSSVLLSEVTPQYMTLDQLYAVMPETLLFLAVCWCWKKLNR